MVTDMGREAAGMAEPAEGYMAALAHFQEARDRAEAALRAGTVSAADIDRLLEASDGVSIALWGPAAMDRRHRIWHG